MQNFYALWYCYLMTGFKYSFHQSTSYSFLLGPPVILFATIVLKKPFSHHLNMLTAVGFQQIREVWASAMDEQDFPRTGQSSGCGSMLAWGKWRDWWASQLFSELERPILLMCLDSHGWNDSESSPVLHDILSAAGFDSLLVRLPFRLDWKIKACYLQLAWLLWISMSAPQKTGPQSLVITIILQFVWATK